jgi:Fur family transcriptional regulator, peroxide stress response regulator
MAKPARRGAGTGPARKGLTPSLSENDYQFMPRRGSEQRAVILKLVRSTMDHPTAAWVHAQARRKLPRIGLGTVYRNLERLTALGLIREIRGVPGPARFDGNMERHYHIRCLGCGRVSDLPIGVTERLEQEAARATDFVILGHEVEVQGLCPGCRDATPQRTESRSTHH